MPCPIHETILTSYIPAEAMEREVLNGPRWDTLSIQEGNDQSAYRVNPLFNHLSFHESPLGPDASETDAQLRFPTSKRSDALILHPIACRSFAAFPLISTFRFLRPEIESVVFNAKGVTVWGVQAALQETSVKKKFLYAAAINHTDDVLFSN